MGGRRVMRRYSAIDVTESTTLIDTETINCGDRGLRMLAPIKVVVKMPGNMPSMPPTR